MMPAPHEVGPRSRTENDRRWPALWVMAAAVSMIVIDGTIVGVALPVIIGDLGLELTDAQWVSAVYPVAFASLLLTWGRVGDRIGRKKVFTSGIAVFMFGSLWAATAQTASTLIAARVLQGVGGSLVLPGTLATVNTLFRTERDRAAAFGVWGAVIAGMAAIGPLLGGWLTTSFTWPLIFVINIPLGALVVVASVLLVPDTRGDSTTGFDVGGLVLSILGSAALVFGLIEGTTLGWWRPLGDFSVLGATWPDTWVVSITPMLLIIGLASLGSFVMRERRRQRTEAPTLLDLSMFSVPTFSWGNITIGLVAIGEFGLLFVLPLFLVNAVGFSTLETGVLLAAMATGAFVAGAEARHIAGRFGMARTVTLGLGLEVIGVLGLAVLTAADTNPWLIAAPLVVYGLGLGVAAAQLTGTTLSGIPPHESGQASATQSTLRQFGAALGSALLGMVLSLSLAASLHVDTGNAADDARLVTATRATAGNAISEIRREGTSGPFGDRGPRVVEELADGFTDATTITLLATAGFLVIAVGTSLRLVAVTDETPAP